MMAVPTTTQRSPNRCGFRGPSRRTMATFFGRTGSHKSLDTLMTRETRRVSTARWVTVATANPCSATFRQSSDPKAAPFFSSTSPKRHCHRFGNSPSLVCLASGRIRARFRQLSRPTRQSSWRFQTPPFFKFDRKALNIPTIRTRTTIELPKPFWRIRRDRSWRSRNPLITAGTNSGWGRCRGGPSGLGRRGPCRRGGR